MDKSNIKIVKIYCKETEDKGRNGHKRIKLNLKDFDNEQHLINHIGLLQRRQKIKNKNYDRIKQGDYKSIERVPWTKIPQRSVESLLELSDFELELDPKTGNTTLLLGSSKMGKSTLMMYLYDKYYKNHISTIISINAEHPQYKRKNLIKLEKFDPNYIKAQHKINMKTKNKYKFLNMIDDMIDVRYSKEINNIILTYRNADMSSIISLQYTNLLAKQSRGSVNNVICFGFNNDESIEVVMKSFLNSWFKKLFPDAKSMEEKINIYRKLTEDHAFLYLANNPKSGKPFLTRHKLTL